MEKNKTGKYFKYAIGEIVLVVIGILIALSINSWNDKRIANNQMTSFLLELKSDLEMDTLGIKRDIKRHETTINNKEKLATLTDYSEISTDNLFNIIIPTGSLYRPTKITFQKITNQGINQISNNDSLSKMIYTYYLETIAYYEMVLDYDDSSTTYDEEYWFKAQNQFEINFNKNYPTFKDDKTNRSGLIKLISEPKGRNIITMALMRKEALMYELEKTKQQASELILKIEKELK